MSAKAKPADPEETASALSGNEAPPAPDFPPRRIDQEAMKRLNEEIEARQRAEAEHRAAAKRPAAEPQPETANMDPALSRAMESLKAHIEAKPRPAAPEPAAAPTPQAAPAPTGKLIQLDFWEDGRRAAPNIVFRSMLFPALKFREGRPFLKQERLFSTKGGEVFFTGEQFDQSDLDVYLEILQFARSFPLGTPVKFSAYSMLNALGRNTGKSDREWLHAVIIRLCGGVVDMTDHKERYFGQLLYGGTRDEITTHYEIILNPKFAALFGYGMWSAIDKEQRRALKQNQTAKALHAYYATHAAPGPHDYETLAEIVGLKDKNPRKVKMKIIAAHAAMKQIGFMPDYEAGATSITAKINHTAGQNHHIAKKIIKSRNRKPKKGRG